jgi:O-methyltransferase involved in polyketide biosynthesis
MMIPTMAAPFDSDMLAQFERNAEFNADNPETRLWVLAWRAIEALGDQGLIDDFAKRFKEAEPRRYSALK